MDNIYKININSGSYNTFNASYNVSTEGNKTIKLMSYKDPYEIEHYRDYLNNKVYEGNYTGYSTSLNLETNRQPSFLIIKPASATISNIQVFKKDGINIDNITSNDILGNLIIYNEGENYRCFCYKEDLSPSINFTTYDDGTAFNNNTSPYCNNPILSLDEQKLTLFPWIYGTYTVTPIQYLFNPVSSTATETNTWTNWTDSVIVNPGSPHDKLMYLRLNVDVDSIKLNGTDENGNKILYTPFDCISPFAYGYKHSIDKNKMKFTYKNPTIDTMVYANGDNITFLSCIFSAGDTNYYTNTSNRKIGYTLQSTFGSSGAVVQICTPSGDSSKKYFYSGNFNKLTSLIGQGANMSFGWSTSSTLFNSSSPLLGRLTWTNLDKTFNSNARGISYTEFQTTGRDNWSLLGNRIRDKSILSIGKPGHFLTAWKGRKNSELQTYIDKGLMNTPIGYRTSTSSFEPSLNIRNVFSGQLPYADYVATGYQPFNISFYEPAGSFEDGYNNYAYNRVSVYRAYINPYILKNLNCKFYTDNNVIFYYDISIGYADFLYLVDKDSVEQEDAADVKLVIYWTNGDEDRKHWMANNLDGFRKYENNLTSSSILVDNRALWKVGIEITDAFDHHLFCLYNNSFSSWTITKTFNTDIIFLGISSNRKNFFGESYSTDCQIKDAMCALNKKGIRIIRYYIYNNGEIPISLTNLKSYVEASYYGSATKNFDNILLGPHDSCILTHTGDDSPVINNVVTKYTLSGNFGSKAVSKTFTN